MGRVKSSPKKFNSTNENCHSSLEAQNEHGKTENIKRGRLNYNVIYNHVDGNKQFYVGEIWIGSTNNVLPKFWKRCKVEYITDENEEESLKMEFNSNLIVIVKVNSDVTYLKGLFSSKVFLLQLIQRGELVFADLYFSKLPFESFTSKIGNIIKTTFSLIYDVKINNSEDHIKCKHINSAIEINNLYEELKHFQNKCINETIDVQHPALVPKVRPYQQEAVKWMIEREKIPEEEEVYLHPMYEKVSLKSGEDIYLNKYTGYVETTPPLVQSLGTGGILADEMGLGKTVEVLACILCNPHTGIDFDSNPSTSLDTSDHNYTKNTTDNCIKSNSIDSPFLEKQSRKRKFKTQEHRPDDKYVDKPKKMKISKSREKFANKSSTYIALQSWYQNVLGTMSIVQKPESLPINKVQCICGDLNEDGIIKCVNCPKYQHISCFKYKRSYGKYRCPQCWENQPSIECKGTLIVCPTALLNQWQMEICRHVHKGLKVLHYEGYPMYPTQLKEYDVVLTTYSVLQSELRLTDTADAIVLRRAPRYSAPGSPIARMKWWRLCLDEAQTIEIPTLMAAEMASKLQAQHRWAVTGTPISKDISDLYGLINFLQFEPYRDEESWNYLLYLPYLSGNKKPMYEFLSKILRRTAKNDVLDQINIPKQTVEVHWLEFSAVEKYFYRREHELSACDFLDKLKNYDLTIPLTKLSKANMKNIMAPLLSIRQSCTQPNAVRGRYLATRKQVTSMKDLLQALIDKNRNESEEHLRITISALNGIAGIHLLLDNPEQAVEEYRKVLQLSARFNKETNSNGGLTIDKLQLIHTLHNLAEVLDVHPSVAPTLRDGNLREDCSKLQEKFMEKYIRETLGAFDNSTSATASVIELQEKQALVEGQWYEDLLNWVLINGFSSELMNRVRTALQESDLNKIAEFSNEKRMLYKLANWSQDVMDLRDETMSLLEQMYCYFPEEGKLVISDGLVEQAAACHLRPQKKVKKENRKKCLVCIVNNKMREYESKLFNTTKVAHSNVSNKGNWKPSIYELVLKALLNLGRAKHADKDLVQNGSLFCNQIVNMKKEFKELRRFWTFLDRQICAQDELDMCKIRLSLKDPSQEQSPKKTKVSSIIKQLSYATENKLETIHMLDPHELDYQRAVLEGEANQHLKALEKTLGTHSYLKTLRMRQNTGQNADPCPICKTVLEDNRSVLPCGHCYCLECIQLLLEQTSARKISCSICRQKHKIEDISYIRTGESVQEQDLIKIKGNYSTKIEAVIKLILRLMADEKSVKVLIFSSWAVILKILKNALTENDIVSELFLAQQVQNSLSKFKDHSKNVTALLLPIQLGSKGLNLIEATHVILVEPLLNPDDELQAIGRVHRIGQTRPTVVHKFYIKNTIEENIYLATSSHAEKWDKNKVTLQELHDLFLVTDDMENVEIQNSQGSAVNDGSIMVQLSEQDGAQTDAESQEAECSALDGNNLETDVQESIETDETVIIQPTRQHFEEIDSILEDDDSAYSTLLESNIEMDAQTSCQVLDKSVTEMDASTSSGMTDCDSTITLQSCDDESLQSQRTASEDDSSIEINTFQVACSSQYGLMETESGLIKVHN